MKIIQKILLATLLFTVAAVGLQAQKGQQRQHDPEKRAEHMTQRMTENLGLSDQQSAQVKAIHLKYAKQMAENHQQAGEGQRPDREAMKAMREAQFAEIKPLLTPDQLTKLEAMKAERAEKYGKGHRGAGRDIDPAERAKHATERMTETLQLTDEQARKVEAIHLDFGKKKQELLQQHQGDQKAARGEMKKLRDEKKTALQSVLTEAQFKQWEEGKPKHHGKRKGGLKQSNDERM